MHDCTRKSYVVAFLFVMIILMITPSAIALETPPLEQMIGHKFSEDYWAVEYDFLSKHLIQDYTPGPFTDELSSLGVDFAPFQDVNCYVAYMNLGQVQTVYLALSNITRDKRISNQYGIAPYQLLLQHFTTAANVHVVVENRFMGLLAYIDHGLSNGVPDVTDKVLYGYAFNSRYHQALLNAYSQIKFNLNPFESIPITSVRPLNITRTIKDNNIEYRFGMSYRNLFVVWMDVAQNTDLNTTDTPDRLLDHIAAYSIFDSINFTYILQGQLVENRATEIRTYTEYDIGKTSDLWILNDTILATNIIGGQRYSFFPRSGSVSRYNTTTSIKDRLNGNENTPGYSLAVANLARIHIISQNTQNQENQKTSIRDQTGNAINGNNAQTNVTNLVFTAESKQAYNVDFVSKPNYTLNQGEPQPAPVKLFPKLNLKIPIFGQLDQFFQQVLQPFIGNLIRERIERNRESLKLTNATAAIRVQNQDVIYTVCFPRWSGGEISQDPVFIAYASPLDLPGGYFVIIMVGMMVVGAVGIAIILLKRYR